MRKALDQLPAFGLINSRSGAEDSKEPGYHVSGILAAAEEFFEQVYLLDPLAVTIELPRRTRAPRIFHGEKDISGLSALMVRSTLGIEVATKVLANALKNCACHMVDPVARFAGARASKTLTTLRRHRARVGSDSYIAFDRDGAGLLTERLAKKGKFPLLAKPVHGYKGIGIRLLESEDAVMQYAEQHFADHPREPLLLQAFVRFEHEYRALLIHGRCLGIVEKIKDTDQLTANAAQGASFRINRDAKLEKFVLRKCSKIGLVGVDVAIDHRQRYHVIEENRAPNWKFIADALDIDIPREILRHVYQAARQS